VRVGRDDGPLVRSPYSATVDSPDPTVTVRRSDQRPGGRQRGSGPTDLQRVVRAAVEWSEDGHGVLDHARFTALLKGYREAGGTLTERASLLVDAALGSRLPWVAYSMRRALGEEGKKPDKRERAHEEAMHALGAWRRLVAQRGDCLSWVRKAAG